MPVPDYQTFMLPLLKCVATAPKSFKAVCEELAEKFRLTDAEKAKVGLTGQPTYVNRVGWAKSYLKQAGLVESPSRGLVKITHQGSKVLNNPPVKIDGKFLAQFPEFVAYKNKTKTLTVTAPPTPILSLETPEETLQRIWLEVNEKLASDILDTVKQIPPAFFERLVVDLMLAMGYGGSREDAGKTVGKSGDGGIDGIINEDRLGLDVIYLQAKRWKGNVGSEIVQTFLGSLVNNGANKGVLLTTSGFTDPAEKAAKMNPTYKIILIDGPRLASLMIEYNLGVGVQDTFVIKRIDQDYFEEPE
ncbi:restriction endonuclease [Armatimonas sp.]|uniref:restriction endonuclease n=1 Tax=Armatimonas sp. TaxID=1872638 RepID=UPI003753CC3C